ncbi:tRNA-splicing endonuclease subunit sen54 [Tieghemiomyces parasiticus]|uniref:tRNA-splicing endonuclease subunit sen54 n=1 Tax=Tieghemiomyces parasiticus TaxID=78921 RepID=A0A9W8DUN4_9FUNG|nr:tRNA-splicing endonuclease subunit sen54 [Tieghemiomyces parasiticus]
MDNVRLQKNHSEALWLPREGLALVCRIRGNLTKTLGFTYRGHMYLSPEEALFEVERGALQLRPVPPPPAESLDLQDYSKTFFQAVNEGDSKGTMGATAAWEGFPLLSTPACYQALLDPRTSALTLDAYKTYGYLRRLGYVVVRAWVYRYLLTSGDVSGRGVMAACQEPEKTSPKATDPSTGRSVPPFFYMTPADLVWRVACYWGLTSQSSFARPYLGPAEKFTSNAEIHDRLNFVSHVGFRASQMTRQPDVALSTAATTDPALRHLSDLGRDTADHFCVYKPSTPYRKKQLVPPDYHVFVKSAQTSGVSKTDILDLFGRTGGDDNAVLAVVENGNLVFLTLSDQPVELLCQDT